MKKTNCAAVTFAALLILGSTVQAQSLSHSSKNYHSGGNYHVAQLANRAKQQANRIVWQTRRMRGFGPKAQHLRRDAIQCLRTANRLQQVANNATEYRTGRRHGAGFVNSTRSGQLTQVVRRLDRDIHHMEDTFAKMKNGILARRTFDGRRGTAYASTDGHGQTPNARHGFAPDYGGRQQLVVLRQIGAMIAQMRGTVHHILEDAQLRRRGPRIDRPGAGIPAPTDSPVVGGHPGGRRRG